MSPCRNDSCTDNFQLQSLAGSSLAKISANALASALDSYVSSSDPAFASMLRCSICPYRAHRQETLDDHVKKHTQKKLYFCSLCDKCFAKPCQLTIHSRTHSGIKPFCCDLCDYKSSQKNNLKLHLFRSHAMSCLFLCKFCLIRFDSQQNLDMHVTANHQQ